MEENNDNDGRQEYCQGSEQAEIGLSPQILSCCFSSLLLLYPAKHSAENVCHVRLKAQHKAQDSHEEEEGTGSFEPEEVQDVVVVVEGWDGRHKNIQGCNDCEDEGVEYKNVDLEESSLPIHNLRNAVATVFLIGFSCLSVADWEEKTSCGIE